MAIIPIFIYRDRITTQELRSEAEFDRRIRQRMEEDEAMKRKREEMAKRKKLMAKLEKDEAILKEIDEAERMNPWEYRVLPEGWGIFGQTTMSTLPWNGTDEEFNNLK